MEPMINDVQLAMIQIGIYVSEFLEPNTLPDSLSEVAEIIHNNLGVKIEQGDDVQAIRDKVIAAIRERNELAAIGEEFYHDFMKEQEEEALARLAKEMADEIDNQIIEDIVIETKKENAFDEAMKVI